MNLRTLKKLSKRAAPLLPLLGDNRKQFPAERWENYTGLRIGARKHWERMRSVHGDLTRGDDIKVRAKDGRGWIWMHPPNHPRKGTIMVGEVSGYYEPEWDEETAYEALLKHVRVYFTDWSPRHEVPPLIRPLRTVTEVFAAARDIIAESWPDGLRP